MVKSEKFYSEHCLLALTKSNVIKKISKTNNASQNSVISVNSSRRFTGLDIANEIIK